MTHVVEDRDISIKSVPATYRGDISELKLIPNGDSALSQGPDFKKMAESALQYLINNPDPAHEYQSRFNLYLLWCPCFAPQAWEWGYGKKLREDGYHIDPVAIGDTESRNDIAFNQMREITGLSTGSDVQDIVHKRLAGYVRSGKGDPGDDLCWCKPVCVSSIEGDAALEWTTCKLMQSEVDKWRLTRVESHRLLARRLFDGLRRIAIREHGRAYYLGGGLNPFRDGKHLQGHFTGCYPALLTPFVNYWQATGDADALTFAQEIAEGFVCDCQPGNLHHGGGRLDGHPHAQMHAIRGLAQLGAVTGNWRFLEWAENVYKYSAANQMDTGWLPEGPMHREHHNHAETCLTADMTEMECWFALGGKPDYWDRVERAIRNYLQPIQWKVTPEAEDLYKRIHSKLSSEEIKIGLALWKHLEGGFLSGPTPNDRIFECIPGANHQGAVDFEGARIVMDMMGCCPPEGMRMLYLAWNNCVRKEDNNVFVNLAFNHDGPCATITTGMPHNGSLSVKTKVKSTFLLRPPSWAPRETIDALINEKPFEVQWSGPANSFVKFSDVTPGTTIQITWPLVAFKQKITERFIDDGKSPLTPSSGPVCKGKTYTFDWVGSSVKSVDPQGRWLPLYGK